MKKVEVRPAVAADSEPISQLLRYIASFHAERRPDIYRDGDIAKYDAAAVRTMIADEDNIIRAAVIDGATVGYTIAVIKSRTDNAIMRDRRVYYIDDFCVSPKHQRLGIGRALFAAAKAEAKLLGCDAVELNVWEANEEAIAFYEACGMTTQRRQMELSLSDE